MYRSTKSSSMNQDPMNFSMYKSSKSSMSSGGANRRYSQPGFPGSSSMYSSRRGSEMVGSHRGGGGGGSGEGIPPSSSQYDDKPPISEVKGGRKGSRKDGPDSTSFDPDQYNPDGSLRTIHCMPSFEDAYKQARKARYIRHRQLQPDEIQLDIKQVFDQSS